MEGIEEEQGAAHIMLLDDVQDSLLTFLNVSIKTKLQCVFLQCVFLRKSFGAKQERSSYPSEFKTRESSAHFNKWLQCQGESKSPIKNTCPKITRILIDPPPAIHATQHKAKSP